MIFGTLESLQMPVYFDWKLRSRIPISSTLLWLKVKSWLTIKSLQFKSWTQWSVSCCSQISWLRHTAIISPDVLTVGNITYTGKYPLQTVDKKHYNTRTNEQTHWNSLLLLLYKLTKLCEICCTLELERLLIDRNILRDRETDRQG